MGLVVFLIDTGILIIISPLNIPFLQPAIVGIDIASGIVAGLVGATTGISYGVDSDKGGMIGDSLKELKELKRELAKLLRHLAYFDEHSSSYLTPDQYMHQLPTLITSYRKQADSYRRWGNVRETRGEDGVVLKGMHFTLTGDVGKPEETTFERK